MNPEPAVTELLRQATEGDALARDALLAAVYQELRRLARRMLAGDRMRHQLAPTELVHGAALKLMGQHHVSARDRAHFLAYSGQVMRQVLRERRARAVRAPDISEPARDAVVPLHALAELYWRQGDAEAACAASRRAIAAWAEYEKRWGLTELDRKQNAEKEREAARRCQR